MRKCRPVMEQWARRSGGARLDTLPARFAAKVSRVDDDPDACWTWTGGRNENGYGQIDRVGAHRVAYYLATGIDPGEFDVLHWCDNPPCVRPSHLFLGTHADNMADSAAKGRATARKTVRDEDVEAIRLLWAEGNLSQTEIGKRYGVGGQQVGRIVRGASRAVGVAQAPWQVRGFHRAEQVLTDDQVAEIRRRYAAGGITQRALAAEFGVGQPHISYIVNGKERVA